jgi:hypothetical protein
MNPEDPSSPDDSEIEYDLWRWHTEGTFPKDQPPEQGYVHIGMFLVWLIDMGMLDPEWAKGSAVSSAIESIRERKGSACALRDLTDGRLASDMLGAEGQAFTGAYYAPEYGYVRDWNRVFGRPAAHYAVPDDWDTYDRIGPLIERRYREWVGAGRPELMPMPRILNLLMRLAQPRIR